MPDRLPLLAVVYDEGASPLEIVAGLEGLAEPVFVPHTTEHARQLAPVLEALGTVVSAAGPDVAAERLRPVPIRGVVTFSEAGLGWAARIGELLGLPAHSAETLAVVTHKGRQRDALRRADVDAVRTVGVDGPGELADALAAVGTPAIVKPAVGSGSRDTFTVTDRDRFLRTHLSTLPREPFQVEEFLPGRDCAPFGDYVSVETVTVRGTTEHVLTSGKFRLIAPLRETGHLWPAPLPAGELDSVAELAKLAVAALGIETGMAHTEIKLTAAGPRLIEVNARLGGFVNQVCVANGNGNLVSVAAAVALGIDHRPYLPDLRHPVSFVFHQLPPLDSRVLVDVRPPADDAFGGIEYLPVRHAGDAMRGDASTDHLDALTGHADSHRDVLRTLGVVVGQFRFTFGRDDGTLVELSGRDLPSGVALAA